MNQKKKFENMKEQEVVKYIDHLSETNGEKLKGYEKAIFYEVQLIIQEQRQTEQELTILENEKQALASKKLILQGKITALTDILVRAEDERRKQNEQ